MEPMLVAPDWPPRWYKEVAALVGRLGGRTFWGTEDQVCTARFRGSFFLRPTPRQLKELADLMDKHDLVVDMLANRDNGISWNFAQIKGTN